MKRYLVMGDEALAIAELQAGCRHNRTTVNTSSGRGTPHLEMVPTDREAEVKSSLRTLKVETEVHAITRALEETRWNRKRAARLLKISYRGLLYKIRQHGITRTDAAMMPIYNADRRIVP